jgi:hypothetical protein
LPAAGKKERNGARYVRADLRLHLDLMFEQPPQQMVESAATARGVCWTNSLYSTWDDEFYPDGIPGVEVMAKAGPNGRA